MSEQRKLTTAAGGPVVDNQNVITAGPRRPARDRSRRFHQTVAVRSGAKGTRP
jgi:catalase